MKSKAGLFAALLFLFLQHEGKKAKCFEARVELLRCAFV